MATRSGYVVNGGAGEVVPSAEKTRMVFLDGFVSFDPVVITFYKMRARDASCVTPTYVTWVTTSPSQVYPGVLPCGGPLVETTIVESWPYTP